MFAYFYLDILSLYFSWYLDGSKYIQALLAPFICYLEFILFLLLFTCKWSFLPFSVLRRRRLILVCRPLLSANFLLYLIIYILWLLLFYLFPDITSPKFLCFCAQLCLNSSHLIWVFVSFSFVFVPGFEWVSYLQEKLGRMKNPTLCSYFVDQNVSLGIHLCLTVVLQL